MRKRRGLASAIVGLVVGLLLGSLMSNYQGISVHLRSRPSTPRSRMAEKRREESNMGSLQEKKQPLEASPSNLVFVGVMTAEKYLNSRAKAVYETWGREVPGRIVFFSSEESKVPDNCPNLPLVSLPTVDDSYPPQKKSFLMLQYMWDNFGDRFEWFLRADDDVYVRTDRLEKLLRSVNSNNALYVGQAGRGNNEEFGLLSLEYDENFCMGGPGVLFSKETLKRIVPHIKYCLKNLYTTHEDVELGRCVRKFAGISCTWSYEMQAILYHNSSGDQAFTGNLKRKEVHRAITLHPIKSPPYMYRLHNYIRGLKIQDLQQERIQLHRDIFNMAKELNILVDNLHNYNLTRNVPLYPFEQGSKEYPGDTKMLGITAELAAFRPKSIDEVIPWDFISRSEYSLLDSNPRRRMHTDIKEGLDDIVREVMTSINACSRQRGRVVEERATLYGYHKVDVYGADTILDLLLVYRKYRGKKVTLPVRRHLYLHQHFTGVEIEEDKDWEEKHLTSDQNSLHKIFLSLAFSSKQALRQPQDKVIHFILPLSGRREILERFLRNYEEICLSSGKEKTELLIVLYPRKSNESVNDTIRTIQNVKDKYKNARIDVILGSGNFSRAKALDLGVSKFQDNNLLFFVDVDIVFTASALRRIRLNTVMGRRMYFPIVFSQYDPKIVNPDQKAHSSFAINEVNGYWRQFGFGIVSLYKKDYMAIGGFNLSIKGWGKEDVDLFEKAVKSDLEVFRSPDENLIHVYHDVDCDSELSSLQLSMCKGTKAETFASTRQLANFIYQHPEYLEYAKLRRLRNKMYGGRTL